MRSIFKALQLSAAAGLLAGGANIALAACGPDTVIAPSGDYSLTFKVCDQTFFGTVMAKGTGWAAVGFSADQFMPQTDVFMAGVLPDGTVYSQDALALFRSPPGADPIQNVTLLSASESNGTTSYTFSRLLSTGDTTNDYDLTQGSYHILMAYNDGSDDLTNRHTYRSASDVAYQFAPVPEPQTWMMVLLGLGLLAARRRRVAP